MTNGVGFLLFDTADQGALVKVLHGPDHADTKQRRSRKWGQLQAVHCAAGLADQLTPAEDFVESLAQARWANDVP